MRYVPNYYVLTPPLKIIVFKGFNGCLQNNFSGEMGGGEAIVYFK